MATALWLLCKANSHLIFVPYSHYDETKTLLYPITSICLTNADGEHYVALSRAKTEAVIVTDDKDRLVRAIYERAGEKQTAMTASAPEAAKSKAMGAGLG